jgi:hypothetical protein
MNHRATLPNPFDRDAGNQPGHDFPTTSRFPDCARSGQAVRGDHAPPLDESTVP